MFKEIYERHDLDLINEKTDLFLRLVEILTNRSNLYYSRSTSCRNMIHIHISDYGFIVIRPKHMRVSVADLLFNNFALNSHKISQPVVNLLRIVSKN